MFCYDRDTRRREGNSALPSVHIKKCHKQDFANIYTKICLEVFDGGKRKDEHECSLVENTGSAFRCHRHEPPLVFGQKSELEQHLMSHADDTSALLAQRFTCPVCQKKFLLRKNLNSHMRMFHEAEGNNKEFKCSYCDKKFYHKLDCEEHENTHKTSKDFHCRCGRQYSSKKALLYHQKLSHVEKSESFKCTICGKVLSNKYKLKYHMGVHSEKRSFKCSHCPSAFKMRENLLRHLKQYHKDLIQNQEKF